MFHHNSTRTNKIYAQCIMFCDWLRWQLETTSHAREKWKPMGVWSGKYFCAVYNCRIFFFWKEGKCFAFVSAVVYERKNKCDGSPNLHCQPVIFTHQLRSPIKIPCSITCIYWHMDLKGRGTHISVSSTFTNCIHSLTGTITLTYTLRFEKELLEINMDKRIFFCWYGGCTLLHTVNVRVTVWVTISPHYQTHRTPLKHTKADSGLGKKRKKAESMASNNAGQESP